ncbi:MAG TPA: hypothetical protein VHC18_11375 [Amycolatopsis sp.]|nr:hypothetical protein [Amycolatopsis sp.]
MITVWLSLLAETVVVTGIAAALARWSHRRFRAHCSAHQVTHARRVSKHETCGG